jgi:hypothetical protein
MRATPHLSDSRSYDVVWASNIVKRAWQHLQNAFQEEGKAEWLEVLRFFVAGGGGTPPNQEEAAESRRDTEFPSRRCVPGFRVCVSVIAKP